MVSLTESKPTKAMWLFALPLLASAIFQQLYNIADTVIVGQFIGEDALAAVGASFPITMVFMAVSFGCNIGCSVIISQLYGGKKMCQMKTAVSTSFISFGILSLVLTGIGLLISAPLMRLLDTPDNIFADSMILYIGNPNDAIRKLLGLINEFSNVSGYKINIQKYLAFLYTINERSEREIQETIPFTIETKRIKYLGIKNKIPRNKPT